MSTQTFLLIFLVAVIALGIVLFQYYYKSKKQGSLSLILAILRFLTFFSALLLLINPKFTKNEYHTEKTSLIVLTDNSSSVAPYREDIETILEKLDESQEINERFNLERYSFGASLKTFDSLSFSEGSTDISRALSELKEIYAGTNSAVVLLSDGNQTVGQDYSFYGKDLNFPIQAIAVGDTTRYQDLAISQVNTNQYAFLKNKFPVEIYVSYVGRSEVKTNVRLLLNSKTIFNQRISLSKTGDTKILTALVEATSVGLKSMSVSIDALPNERNRVNNSREFAIEVIDEKTNVAIISSIAHPDIGALKKAIESNEQRSVSIKKPESDTKELENVDLFILYQPDVPFQNVYDYVQQRKSNVFTITGTETNWNFLNKAQKKFTKNSYDQFEEIFPVLDQGFGLFNASEFSLLDFPPLRGNLGEIILNVQGESLLNQRIKGVELNEPLLAFFDNDSQREAVLFGENSWKWRIQSYRNDQNFNNYDDLIGKIILFLDVNKAKERLTLGYESVYSGSNEARISATYFDKAFVFDDNATLTAKIKSSDSKVSKEVPMLLKGQYYEADLSNLDPGDYEFTVNVKSENLSKSGNFSILDFDIEKQFLSTDAKKMTNLADNTAGMLFYPAQTNELVSALTEDNRFVPIQKSKQNVVSLIDFRILLALLAATLAAEWFIRKYNGLI